MRNLFFVSLVLVLLCSAFTYKPAGYVRDLKEWSDTLSLSWNDYKGGITDTTRFVSTNCGLSCIPQIVGDTASITVIAYMDKNKSWYRKKYADDALLLHEKGHFDLTEIFARKMKKRVLAERMRKKEFIAEVKIIYEKTWNDLQQQHQAYDKATGEGTVEFAQRTWQNYIKENLVMYYPYAQQTIKFPIAD